MTPRALRVRTYEFYITSVVKWYKRARERGKRILNDSELQIECGGALRVRDHEAGPLFQPTSSIAQWSYCSSSGVVKAYIMEALW